MSSCSYREGSVSEPWWPWRGSGWCGSGLAAWGAAGRMGAVAERTEQAAGWWGCSPCCLLQEHSGAGLRPGLENKGWCQWCPTLWEECGCSAAGPNETVIVAACHCRVSSDPAFQVFPWLSVIKNIFHACDSEVGNVQKLHKPTSGFQCLFLSTSLCTSIAPFPV